MTTPNWALTFKSYRGSARLYTVYGDRGTLHFTQAALLQSNWVIVGTVHRVAELETRSEDESPGGSDSRTGG